jgi:hypothetical protein
MSGPLCLAEGNGEPGHSVAAIFSGSCRSTKWKSELGSAPLMSGIWPRRIAGEPEHQHRARYGVKGIRFSTKRKRIQSNGRAAETVPERTSVN